MRCAGWLRNQKGAAALECTLLIPLLAMFVVAFLFLSLYGFQSGWVYATAEQTAERIAEYWHRSRSHPKTGMYVPLQNDPLYWRLLQDGDGEWPYGEDNGSEHHLTLTEYKLAKGMEFWPKPLEGRAAYRNQGWRRFVTVSGSMPFRAPALPGVPLPSRTEALSQDVVLEPAELIRNVDFLIASMPLLQGGTKPDDVRQAMSPWLKRTGEAAGSGQSVEFATHQEAVLYLRTLVRGKERRIPTEQVGSWRLIDALDGQGIAHQAYIGTSGKFADLMFQLQKDEELLARGKVNGVVWHFFRRRGETAAGPSPQLRHELMKRGITIIIHS